MAINSEYQGYWDALEEKRKQQQNPLAGGQKGRQVLDLAYKTVPLGKNEAGDYMTASDYVNTGMQKAGQGIMNFINPPDPPPITSPGANPFGVGTIGGGAPTAPPATPDLFGIGSTPSTSLASSPSAPTDLFGVGMGGAPPGGGACRR